MDSPNFKIYGASAGSGKTYALAKAYIKLLLANSSPGRFRQILALTFTNKAVEEMKTRILDNLHSFSQKEVPKGLEPLFGELCRELSLDPEALRERSGNVLKGILHNYSFFEVSTIDKFNHKIVRTFARDLRLSQNFEVELDLDLLLGEAVGRLLDRAGSEPELTRTLIEFSLEKLDEDKSWDIAHDLFRISKLLTSENHWDHLEPLRSMGVGDFKAVQDRLSKGMGEIRAKVAERAEGVLGEIRAQGFEPGDFPRGTLPNHFVKIIEGRTSITDLYKNKLEQNLEEGKLLKVSDQRDITALAAHVLGEYREIKAEIYRLDFMKNVYGNIVPMTVLNEIAREIKNIELERDLIPISALNSILSKEIKGQPVPFIYERLGEKYRHFFIDEFQDTSKMQWENLLPLVSNALESEGQDGRRGSLFLVGDVKQAIYRWRGGRAEGLLDLIDGRSHPFVVDPEVHSLETNWRSRDNIVEFNNAFFASIAPVLGHGPYRDLYLEGAFQKTGNRPGGIIELSFLEEDKKDLEEAYCQRVMATIDRILAQGHSHGDICVLVRKNDQGRLLADFLAQREVPIVSSEALLLASDGKVGLLIALLQLLDNPGDRSAAYGVLMSLCPQGEDRHRLVEDRLGKIQGFLLGTYDFDLQRLRGASVHEILERAIVQFDLGEGSVSHILFLMDLVLEVEKMQGPGIHAFLRYWEAKKDKLSIAAPSGLDAVQIMTVHKAKGLEFPFVIFPFANDPLEERPNGKKIWVPAGPMEADLGLGELLVNYKKDLQEYGQGVAARYTEERERSVLDAINVLYVALTRPVGGLFVITAKGKERKGPEDLESYGELFWWHLQDRGVPLEPEGVYRFGSLPKAGEPHKVPVRPRDIPYSSRPKGDRGFAISTRTGRLWENDGMQALAMGNLIHLALSQIQTAGDLPQVLIDLDRQGHIPGGLLEEVGTKLREVVEHPLLANYFSPGATVLNERELLTPQGRAHRPDRILLQGKRATLIDYKTGLPHPSHREQIGTYAQLLQGMGLEVEESILVYIAQKVEPVFI